MPDVNPLDPRLGRMPEWDERNDDYQIRQLLAEDRDYTPRSYTWRVDTWLDQGDSGACFPAGTLVRMADGSHQPIEKVRTLDQVVTAEGRTGRVLATSVRLAERLLRLRCDGHRHLTCTPEHPVLVRRNHGSRRHPQWRVEYVAAGDLRAGDFADYVALTSYLPDDLDLLDVPSVVAGQDLGRLREGVLMVGGVESHVVPLPEVLGLTPSLGRLVGLYAAEGHVSDRVVWSYGKHEAGLVQETVDLLKDCLGARPRVQRRPNNCVNVVLPGKAWAALFSALVPGTAKHGDKRLSGWVTRGSRPFLRALIEGWQDGDGHRRRSTTTTVTVSHRLAMDMHAVMQGLGMAPTVRCSNPSENRHAASRQVRWDVEVADSPRVVEQDGLSFRRFQGAEAMEVSDWVFNLEVEGDHSYVAEGIGVHNCVGFSIAHDLAARPVVVEEADNDLGMALYHEAQKLDPWEGESYEGTSVLAGFKAARNRGYITEYRWAYTLEDAITTVGYFGPVVLGSWWYSSMYEPDSCGGLHVYGNRMGGHAYLLYSVDYDDGFFRMWNSWGRSWGNLGTAKLYFEDFERLLSEDGEVAVPVVRERVDVAA